MEPKDLNNQNLAGSSKDEDAEQLHATEQITFTLTLGQAEIVRNHPLSGRSEFDDTQLNDAG